MPEIILKDKSGTEQTYDYKKISFRTPTEGEKAEFIFPNFAELEITENGEYDVPEGVDGYTKVKANVPVPTLFENMEVPLDFSNGDMFIEVPDGYAVKSAIIKQPANLVPENIAKGIVIAGIVGTHEGGGGGDAVVTWTKFEEIEDFPTTDTYGVDFNNTGSRLAAVGGGGAEYSELVVYDTTTTPFTRVDTGITYTSHWGRWGVFSPDGSKLAVGFNVSARGKVYVYDVTTTPYKQIFTTSYSSYIGYTATFSKDGTLLYVPIGDTMYVYSVSGNTISQKTKFSLLCSFISNIAINPQNTRLAVTTADSGAPIKLIVFDITNNYAQVNVLSEDIDSGSYPRAYGVTFNKTGDRLFVSVFNPPYIKIFDTTTEPYSQIYNIDAWADYSYNLVLSPTGDILATSQNGLYDISGSVYTKISDTPDPNTGAYACAFSPDGKYIAFGVSSGSPLLEVWVKTITTA